MGYCVGEPAALRRMRRRGVVESSALVVAPFSKKAEPADREFRKSAGSGIQFAAGAAYVRFFYGSRPKLLSDTDHLPFTGNLPGRLAARRPPGWTPAAERLRRSQRPMRRIAPLGQLLSRTGRSPLV